MTDNEGSGFGLWPRSHRSPAGEAPRTEVPRCGYVCGLSERVHEDARTGHAFYEAAAAPPEPQSTPGATAAFYRARRSAPPEPPRPDQSPVVRCPLCEHPWPCDLHPAPEESGSPASESLETTIRHAVLLGMERASDFYGASGPDAKELVASLVEQVMNGRVTADQWDEKRGETLGSGSPGLDPRTGRPPWDTEV